MEHFGEKMRVLRKSKGWTQRQIEEKLSLGNSTVSGWEKMANPPFDSIVKICDLFKLPLYQFFMPDDLIIPDLAPNEAEFLKLFKTLPDQLQAIIIEQAANTVEAWTLGKKGV